MEQPTIQSQTQEMPSLERTLLEMLQTEKAEAEELLKKTQKEIQKKAEAIQLEKERSFDAHLSELKKLPPKEYLNALKKLFPTSKDIKERRRYLGKQEDLLFKKYAQRLEGLKEEQGLNELQQTIDNLTNELQQKINKLKQPIDKLKQEYEQRLGVLLQANRKLRREEHIPLIKELKDVLEICPHDITEAHVTGYMGDEYYYTCVGCEGEVKDPNGRRYLRERPKLRKRVEELLEELLKEAKKE